MQSYVWGIGLSAYKHTHPGTLVPMNVLIGDNGFLVPTVGWWLPIIAGDTDQPGATRTTSGA